MTSYTEQQLINSEYLAEAATDLMEIASRQRENNELMSVEYTIKTVELTQQRAQITATLALVGAVRDLIEAIEKR